MWREASLARLVVDCESVILRLVTHVIYAPPARALAVAALLGIPLWCSSGHSLIIYAER